MGVGESFGLSATLISIHESFLLSAPLRDQPGALSCGITRGLCCSLGWSFVDHAAQLCAQAFNFGELLLHTLEKRRLRLNSFVNQKARSLGAITENSGRNQLVNFLLSSRRNFYGYDVIILR